MAFVFFFAPQESLAQFQGPCPNGTVPGETGCVSASTPGAGGLIPCAGPDCRFSDLVRFANTIISWLLRIAIPVSAALFSYAGFLYLTSEGNPGKKAAANKVFQSVFWGFIMALGAWIFVNFLTNFFLNKDADRVLSLTSPSTVIISSYDLL